MPIHYACVLNQRTALVLHGVYKDTETIFKTQVLQNSNRIKRFSYSEAPLDNNLRIMYHNWDTVTAAIVVSHEVDQQECGEFLEQFKAHLEANVLGKSYTAPTGMNDSDHESDRQLYLPF